MSGARAGNVLIMTGFAGLKGTLSLLEEERKELEKRFSASFLDSAGLCLGGIVDDLEKKQSVDEDVLVFRAGKDGIFADLWDLGVETGLGLEIDLRKIPVRQETIEVANHLDVNPYEISTEGSLLISASGEEAIKIKRELDDIGINADVIGGFNDGNDRVLLNRGAKRFLTPLSRIEDEKRLRASQKNRER